MRCEKIILLLLGALAFANAGLAGAGVNDPPHYLFPYVPDTTDNPPLYYTKVCPASFIGPGCFARCEALESVRFQGDVPRLDHSYRSTVPYLGEKLYSYNGLVPRFKVFVPQTAFGWVRPYARGVPEKWPVDFGWMNAYPVEGYDLEKPRGLMMTISKTDD